MQPASAVGPTSIRTAAQGFAISRHARQVCIGKGEVLRQQPARKLIASTNDAPDRSGLVMLLLQKCYELVEVELPGAFRQASSQSRAVKQVLPHKYSSRRPDWPTRRNRRRIMPSTPTAARA